MHITDAIWGTAEITEPVLQELIESKPVQRLKGINQHGASMLTDPSNTVTRYEHSIGVMLLLRKLKATVKEQIAGLLHDVPHTAFSHVTDHVFNDLEESYHDTVFEKIVLESEIPDILARYGIDVQEVLDKERHALLEQPLPNLCADRIDYALRDGNNTTQQMEYEQFVEHFVVHDGKIVMDNPDIALAFAREYLRLNTEFWAHPKEAASYAIMAQAIRRELDVGCITEDDLFLTDDEFLKKMRLCADEESQRLLNLLAPGFSVECTREKEADLHTPVKIRYVDPDILDNTTLTRVSERYQEFQEDIETLQERCTGGYYVRIN